MVLRGHHTVARTALSLYRPCAHVARRIAIHRYPDLADRATWNRFTTSEGDEKLSAAPGCLSPPGVGDSFADHVSDVCVSRLLAAPVVSFKSRMNSRD
jgi:hypothetical protein